MASIALFVAGFPFAIAMVATDDYSGLPIALAGLIPMAGLVCGAIGLARHRAADSGACMFAVALNLMLAPALLGFALLPLHGWLPW